MGDPWFRQSPLSLQEYEALEKVSGEDLRYEFMDGVVYAMSGGTIIHNRIIQNCAFSLRNCFGPKGCQVLTENVKLEVAKDKRYVYPDVMVSCSDRDWQSSQLIKDPVLIIEVLSDSTERKDLIQKVEMYQAVPGLKAYIIIDQYSCWIRMYERSENGSWNAHQHLNNPGDTLSVTALSWQLSLTEIYQNVSFARS